MPVDPRSGLLVLGEGVPYLDGAEDDLLAVVEAAGDRSIASDELASAIVDWPTLYHLSRQRANLVRHLRIGPGQRVLEVGCGTGAVTRWLGETGAQVVGLEGSLARARVASARCVDLPNVEIVVGSLDELRPDVPFDVVVVVGVLEYSGDVAGGAGGAPAFLDRCRALAADDGALVLAIENQIGLKYLLGYEEDHRGVPFVGVVGYPGPGARTWSRRELGALLATSGFPVQRWQLPYPDYKLPSIVVDESAFAAPDATDLVDRFVRFPCSPLPGAPFVVADDRAAHRVLLAAGLGLEVGNSLLVVASREPATVEGLVPPGLIWLHGGERAALWRRDRVVVEQPDGERVLLDRSGGGFRRERGWLRQRLDEVAPVHRGTPLDVLALEALAAGDEEQLASTLKRWRAALDDEVLHLDGEPSTTHPFLPATARRVLPSRFLDVGLDNFVLDGDGLAYIDQEWEGIGGVDADLVALRALRHLAVSIVEHGLDHPFSPDTTVDDLTTSLAARADVPSGEPRVAELCRAEAQLQAVVTGKAADVLEPLLVQQGQRSRLDTSPRQVPVAQLQRDVRQLVTRVEELDAALAARSDAAEVEELRAQLERREVELAAANQHLGMWAERWAKLERRPPIRAYLILRRLLGGG